jgi:hypothetical protein
MYHCAITHVVDAIALNEAPFYGRDLVRCDWVE